MKIKKGLSASLIMAVLMIPSLLWAQGTIELSSRVEMEVIKLNEQGEGKTVLVPAEKVLPGETVVYTNTFTNTGKEPAEDLVMNNPIPEHTNYIVGSAFGEAEIVFSADKGKTFALEGKVTVIGEDGKPRPAKPEEYTNLRWNVSKQLQSGESGDVGFRVRLK